MKHNLVKMVPLGIGIFGLLLPTPVFAQEGSIIRNVTNNVEKATDAVDQTKETTERKLEYPRQDIEARLQKQRELVIERKAEIQAKMEDKANKTNQEKLEGRRLAQCQNRQGNINSLLHKSANVGRERLARIQRVEEGVKAFYENQELSSLEYEAALQVADEKEAAAIAVLDVMTEQEFDCTKIDSLKPSDTIKSSRTAKREALNVYRESVKDLMHIVREALVSRQSSAGEGAQE